MTNKLGGVVLFLMSVILFTASCVFEKTTTSPAIAFQEMAIKCAKITDANACVKEQNCFWNFDRCEAKPKDINEFIGLTDDIKVKQISVGKGACFIDQNDKLWCYPKGNANFPLILPHPDHTFTHVDATIPEITEKGDKFVVCATEDNGRAFCFKEKSANVTTVGNDAIGAKPIPYFGTSCLITKSNSITCQSREAMFSGNKFDEFRTREFSNNTAAKNIHLSREFMFLSEIEQYLLGIETTNHDLLIGYVDKGVWTREKRLRNVTKVVAWENALCWIEQGKKGIVCNGWITSNLPKFLNPLIKIDNEVIDLAIATDYACVILASHDLICACNPKLAKNMPANVQKTQAKHVAISDEMMCFITMDDKLACLPIDG